MRLTVARRGLQVVGEIVGRGTSSLEIAVENLRRRGLVENSTKFDEELLPKSSAVYVGFDPTADSLHTGNLLAIAALIHCQSHGCQPIAIVGGATGVVGDPSGRKKERDVLACDLLERNKAGLRENIVRIFNNASKYFSQGHHCQQIQILDNADWWRDVRALEFVSSMARHFRLGSMLSKDSVKLRLESESEDGMSCAEFLYPIFQGYDFLHLHRNHNCWMQIGGGDQWGNIHAGVEFVKRASGAIVHGVTLPLLTSSKGEKLGKSVGNAIWLSPDKTSPYQFYQHFVQTTDQEVEQKLKFFTFLESEEIEAIMKEHRESPHKFGAQKSLAENVTRLVHGDPGVEKALNATAALFGNKDKLVTLPRSELEQVFQDAPCYQLSLDCCHGKRIVDILHVAGIYQSIGDAEYMVKLGGLYLNFERVQSAGELFCPDQHILPSSTTVFRIGKKNFKLIQWEQ